MPRKTAAERVADEIAAAAAAAIAAGFNVLEIHCGRRRTATVCRAIDIVGDRFPGMMRDERTLEDWEPENENDMFGRYSPRYWVPLYPDRMPNWENLSDHNVDPNHLYF